MAEADLNTDNAPEWAPYVEPLRSDPDLAPHLDKIPEKTVADLVKSHVHLSRKLGNSVQIPDPTKAKPEEIKAFKESVYKAGLFESAPETSDKYVKPGSLPDDMWTAPVAQEFKTIAHELGLSQKQIERLAEFDVKRFNDMKGPLAQDVEAAKKQITEQWAKEGKGYDEMMTLAIEGMAKRNFTEAEVKALDVTGALSHPVVLSALAKIGEAFKDSHGLIGEEVVTDDDLAQFQPGGAKWELLSKGDPKTLAERDALYAKRYPGMANLG